MACFASVPIFICAPLLNKVENIPSIRRLKGTACLTVSDTGPRLFHPQTCFGAHRRPLNVLRRPSVSARCCKVSGGAAGSWWMVAPSCRCLPVVSHSTPVGKHAKAIKRTKGQDAYLFLAANEQPSHHVILLEAFPQIPNSRPMH